MTHRPRLVSGCRRRLAIHASLAVIYLSLAGCAAYGWSNRPAETRVDRVVVVRTVDVDAHAAVSAAELTRDFVTELQRAGVPRANWTGAARPSDVVTCDIFFAEEESFDERGFVSASARCLVDQQPVGIREANAQLALGPEDRTLGRRRAAEIAARRALQLVASDVAQHLSRN